MSIYDDNKKKVPELDNFKDTKNDFLQSIYNQSQSRALRDNQVDAANRVYEKFKNPPVIINFDSKRSETLMFLCALMMNIQGRYASEFVWKMNQEIHQKGKLTQKQYAALLAKFEKYKKALMKRIWH